ncbi:uncharacterized protein LOC133708977 [Rosa rugosa]|uniref:uncharacterized protein LOC133708977 n=1 Tax=Rosa rugosa TaxID=74645 RepID=UPI002B40E9DF|nr:uncharacterized protein LOC133708977 [Rosa rugosa]
MNTKPGLLYQNASSLHFVYVQTSKKGGKKGKKQKKSIKGAVIAINREERKPGIRISDGVSNNSHRESHTPTLNSPIRCENETTSDYSKRPPRGKAKGDKDFKNKGRVEVQFNVRGQPYGEYAAGFSSFLGVTAREFVPLTTEWKNLTNLYKRQIWEHITQKYIVPEICKKNVFRKMMKLWRDYRSLTMKEVMQQAESVGLPRAAALLKPDNIDSMEVWLDFVKSRTTEAFREKCERFKLMRQGRTLLHRTSRKSFACLEEELKQQSETPDAISRSDIWLCAYEVKKKAVEEVEDPKIVKLVRKYKEEEEVTQPCSIKADAIAKALSPELRG